MSIREFKLAENCSRSAGARTLPAPWHVALLVLLLQIVLALPTLAQEMTVAPDRATGVYRDGDTVHWTIEWTGNGIPPSARYTVKKGGLTPIGQGDVRFTGRTAALETRFEAPSTVLVEINWQPSGPRNRAVGGAVADPERITPAAPPPADFDAFWQAGIRELRAVGFNAKLDPGDSDKAGVSYWKVTLDNIRGTHIHGQLARPQAGEKFPALLIVQWAGVYPLQKSWAADRAAEGWLTLNIEAHDLPIDMPGQFYDEQFAGPLRNYWSIGNDDRNRSYFLRMYLSCYQAIEYLKSRSDWDRKTLVVMGASQGGQQTLMIAGLHPRDITAALALVPAGCDMLAPQIGRAPGWPQWYYNVSDGKDPARVRETARYYDVANFARHIRCPVLVGLGLRDETCPPSSVLAALHNVRGAKEIVILPTSGHQNENGSQRPYEDRCYGAWLPALLHGRPVPVAQLK